MPSLCRALLCTPLHCLRVVVQNGKSIDVQAFFQALQNQGGLWGC